MTYPFLHTSIMELKPGGIYVIELTGEYSADQQRHIRAFLQAFGEPLDIRFLLLPEGIRIVRHSIRHSLGLRVFTKAAAWLSYLRSRATYGP